MGHKIGKNDIGGVCSTYGGEQRCIHGFDGEPEGGRPFGRPRCRWEDDNKLNLPEKECEPWTGFIWLRVGTGGGHLRMW